MRRVVQSESSDKLIEGAIWEIGVGVCPVASAANVTFGYTA